jgi:hypothetical protein
MGVGLDAGSLCSLIHLATPTFAPLARLEAVDSTPTMLQFAIA